MNGARIKIAYADLPYIGWRQWLFGFTYIGNEGKLFRSYLFVRLLGWSMYRFGREK